MSELSNRTPREMQMPVWTREDFGTTKPYEWLYQFHDDQYITVQLYNKMSERAKALKVTNFVSTWRAFVNQMRVLRKAALAGSVTEFTGQPIELDCGTYKCEDTGVYRIDKNCNESVVIWHPIMPVQIVKNIETQEEKTKLAYNVYGNWEYITVPNETLSNTQKIISLSSKGIRITSENARDVVRFLSDIGSRNKNVLPIQKATSHLGWQPDGSFSPFDDGIAYDGNNAEYLNMFEFVATPCGDEQKWMDLALKVRSGASVPARIALAASFAAPLLAKVKGLPFFVHLWGTQGCGKTVGLMFAASVWGDPVIGKYPKTFMATKVAIERIASFYGNLPVIFDELQVIADRHLYDDLIYMLCEGASKGRGLKDDGMQAQKRWNTVIITSGEMPIVQEFSGGGAAVRTIEVNYGGQPLFIDPHSAVEIMTENYGFAGRKIIAAIKDSEVMEELKNKRESLYQELVGSIDEKQVLAASILLVADWLAERVIFHDGKNLQPSELTPFLVSKTEADKQRRCYEWLQGFIAANDTKFHPDDKPPECWGVIEGDIVYFIKSKFDEQVTKAGYSPGAFLAWAVRENVIIRENYGVGAGKKRLTVRKTVNGARIPCVALVRKEDDGQSGWEIVDPGEELPFMRD